MTRWANKAEEPSFITDGGDANFPAFLGLVVRGETNDSTETWQLQIIATMTNAKADARNVLPSATFGGWGIDGDFSYVFR
mmetsp:Transcript_6965/g.14532  ORF Transcript_6965/g.14532 Transcript_6965/m.14532 type:complete len:80 (-) Transcript_6965:144-383(-)